MCKVVPTDLQHYSHLEFFCPSGFRFCSLLSHSPTRTRLLSIIVPPNYPLASQLLVIFQSCTQLSVIMDAGDLEGPGMVPFLFPCVASPVKWFWPQLIQCLETSIGVQMWSLWAWISATNVRNAVFFSFLFSFLSFFFFFWLRSMLLARCRSW